MGWIAAIIVLAAQRFRHVPTVRFHAFQGLYLFVAWLMNDQVLKFALAPISHLHHLHDLVSLVLLAMSVFMMVKASHDEAYSCRCSGAGAPFDVGELTRIGLGDQRLDSSFATSPFFRSSQQRINK